MLLRPILLPTFQLTIGLVALIVAFGASASLAKQYRLPERLCGLTGCLAFLLFIGFRETAVSNVYLGGMGIFTALISSTYSIEIIRFFYKKGWCIRLPDEVPLMTRNGFQLLIPLLVVMLSISVMNADTAADHRTHRTGVDQRSGAAAGAGVRHADGGTYLFIYL